MAEGGRVKGDCLECPFHSWTFHGENGYCESIPYTEKGINQVLHNFRSFSQTILVFTLWPPWCTTIFSCFLHLGTTFLHRDACLCILTYNANICVQISGVKNHGSIHRVLT